MNAVLITADSLRRDFLLTPDGRVLGDSAPNLKRFAESAIVFPNAVAQAPYTRASFASLFTSRYPSFALTPSGRLSDRWPTMADILRKHGYRTCGIHSNPFLSPPFGFHRGFEHFRDNLVTARSRVLPGPMRVLTTKVLGLLKKRAYLDADAINDQAETWLRSLGESDRFFLWIHYMDTHGPYYIEQESSVLERYRAELLWRKAKRSPSSVSEDELDSMRDRYRTKISWLDERLERVFRLLDERGLAEDTAVVFTADHGDAFREHGEITHTRQLYEELVNVPFILRDPKGARGSSSSQVIGLMDVAPTILDILGVSVENLGFEGVSLRTLLSGEARRPRPILSEAVHEPDRHPVISVRMDRWKYIANGERTELYDLEADPMERRNIAEDHPDIVKRMDRTVAEHLRSHLRDGVDVDEVDVDEEAKRRLRALGYYD